MPLSSIVTVKYVTFLLPLLLLLLLLHVLILLVSIPSPFDSAHASTITNGTYTSTDGTIPSSGTVLDVPSMLADAATNGLSEAVCTFTRTTFDGTLTITLPTTAAAWTTSNIPLRLLIQDGGTSGNLTDLTIFINVTGYLAMGSSIIVQGGGYDYTDTFIDIPSRLTIQDGSTVSIEGGKYRLHYPTVGGYQTSLIKSWMIKIRNNGTLLISNNSMGAYNVSVGSSWLVFTIYTFSSSPSPITVDNSSTLSISSNSMEVYNVSVGGWWLYTIYSYPTPMLASYPIIINTSSTLSISNNRMWASNVSVRGAWYVYTIHTLSPTSPITVDTSSTLSIYNDTLAIFNVSVSGDWYINTIFIYSSNSPITVDNSSTLSISNNSMEVYNVLNSYPKCGTIRTYGSLEVNGVMEVVNNVVIAEGGDVSVVQLPSNSQFRGTGVLFLSRNKVMNVASGLILYIGTLGTSVPSIRTCKNYVNDTVCRILEGGAYPCAGGGVDLRGNITEECPITETLPIAASVSHTGSHDATRTSEASATLNTNTNTATLNTTTTTPTLNIENATLNTNTPTPNTENATLSISQRSSPSSSGTPMSAPITVSLLPPSSSPLYTLSTQPVCQSSPQPCTYASAVAYSNTTSLCAAKGLSITVPHSTWGSSSDRFLISVLLHDSLFDHFKTAVTPPAIANSSSQHVIASSGGVTQYAARLTTRNDDVRQLWAVTSLTYTGPSSRSATSLDIYIQLPLDSFNCVFATDSPPTVPVRVTLSGAVSAIAEAVVIVTAVSVAVSAVSVVPAGLVRAGISASVLNMLRCSEFEPNEEVGLVNNPFNWAVGGEEMQYHRGSVLTALIAMVIVSVCIIGVMVVIRMWGASVTTWRAVFDTLRLPSLPLVFLVLLSEMAVSSAISLLLFSSSSVVEIVSALAVLAPLSIYMGLYLQRTIVCGNYVTVVPVTGANINGSTATSGADERPKQRKRTSVAGRVVKYAMEPTHDLIVNVAGDEEETNALNEECVVWLRRNYYFVADRSWAQYGAIEVIGGTLTNMLEGIPLTTTSRALCIARPACVMLISAVLLALLIWKTPNAVRLQHWCSLFVLGGMLLTSTLVTINSIKPSENIELAAGYISFAVVGVSTVLGIVDMIVLAMTYIPTLRSLLSFRVGGLQSTIKHSQTLHELNVPLLHIPPHNPPTPPPQGGPYAPPPDIAVQGLNDKIQQPVPPLAERVVGASSPPPFVATSTHITNTHQPSTAPTSSTTYGRTSSSPQQLSTTTPTSLPTTKSSPVRTPPKPAKSSASKTVPLQSKPSKKTWNKANKKASDFDWNPKGYVPMERPYTMLYEEDFTPPSDEKDDDMYLEMDNLSHSIELDDDDGDNDDNLKSQESDAQHYSNSTLL